MKILTKALPLFLILIISNNFLIAGDQIGKVRTFKSLDGIALLGSGNAKIVHGNRNEIVIHAPADLIPYLATYVEDGTLKIGKRKKGWNKFRFINEKIRYDIVVKKIDHIKVSGSGNITADKLDGNECYLKISGSGNIDVSDVNGDITLVKVSGSGDIEIDNLHAKMLNAAIGGSGNIDVKGKVDELELNISGSGDFDSNGLKTKEAVVNIYGSGDASFACSDRLEANTTGSGDITCYGNPSVRSHSTGSGTIITR